MYLSQNVSCYVFCCSVAQSCLTLCDLMDCSMPDFPVLPYLLELAQTHVHWVGDAIQPSHPLLSPSPAFNLSQHQGLFQCVSSLHMWPKYWSSSISLSNEYSGLISFRMDWLDLLAVQGTLKSLLQHHSSKVSILRCSAFFTVQLSHSYMTTAKLQKHFRLLCPPLSPGVCSNSCPLSQFVLFGMHCRDVEHTSLKRMTWDLCWF